MTLPNSKFTPETAQEKKPMPWHIVFFLGPALLIYLTFSVYPLLDTLILSLYDEQQGQSTFVGLQNFITLISDDTWSSAFWNALGNNFKFFIIHMLVQNPIGLLLAVLLSSPKLRFSGSYRTFIFMPTMLSVVIIGFVWQLLLSPIWGISENFL